MKDMTFFCNRTCFSDTMFESYTLQKILSRASTADDVRRQCHQSNSSPVHFSRGNCDGTIEPVTPVSKGESPCATMPLPAITMAPSPTNGIVDDATIAALERLRATGRRLVLVTGRQLPDLKLAFPRLEIFDRVVAENGALLYRPETREEMTLGAPPPPEFVAELRRRGVDNLSEGKVIVATWEPHDHTVLDLIHEMGLEYQVIFNKGAVMVLPSGVNKAFGLRAALKELGLSSHNVVAVGDAENDHAFISICECAVAVANALPALKKHADLVTEGQQGKGVTELVELLLQNDLTEIDLGRHEIPLGNTEQGEEVRIPPTARISSSPARPAGVNRPSPHRSWSGWKSGCTSTASSIPRGIILSFRGRYPWETIHIPRQSPRYSGFCSRRSTIAR